MEHNLLEVIFILLALGAALVALCVRFGVPPILGYLAAGLMAGPHLLGWLPDSPETRFLAEVGVVLLMFTIGLEFSLPKLLAAKRLVLGLGGAQIAVTAALFAAIAWWTGLTPQAAFVIGAALAMSSTAIALKQLGEQMELGASHGQAAVGILLAQDMAAVPLLAIIPALAGAEGGLAMALALPMLKAAALFIVMMTLGEKLLHPLLRWVAATRSLEMFMLAALLVVASMAAMAHALELSPALGAFLAGMVLGESEFRHQMEADIRPFRDLMLGLFFATIGMQLDPRVLWQLPHWVAVILAGLLLLKLGVIAALARAFGLGANAAWRAGVSLSEAGEFGLLLLSLGLSLGLLPQQPAQVLLTAMVLSMVLAPFLVRYNGAIAARLAPEPGPAPGSDDAVSAIGDEFADHVIICGYGRLGQNLAILLRNAGIDSLALDLDIERVRQAADAGEEVVFGDATNSGVLAAAGLERARAVAVTFDEPEQEIRVARHARFLRQDLPVLLRCRNARHADELRATGAEVFPEGLETSLTFAAQLLALLDVPADAIETLVNDIRAEEYAPLLAFFHAGDDDSEAASHDMHRRSVIIREGDFAVGHTPREVGIGRADAELEHIMRGGIRVPGHKMDTFLKAGDILVLKGKVDGLDAAERRLRG